VSITLVESLAGTSFNVRTGLFQERIGYTEINSYVGSETRVIQLDVTSEVYR
jgi:hypothetical protein